VEIVIRGRLKIVVNQTPSIHVYNKLLKQGHKHRVFHPVVGIYKVAHKVAHKAALHLSRVIPGPPRHLKPQLKN
jgi:hypothetical protein